MRFDDPTYARKGSTPAERFNLFGTFLDGAAAPAPLAAAASTSAGAVPRTDPTDSVLALAAQPDGVGYATLLRALRAAGLPSGDIVAAVNALVTGGLVTRTDDIVRITPNGRALLPVET